MKCFEIQIVEPEKWELAANFAARGAAFRGMEKIDADQLVQLLMSETRRVPELERLSGFFAAIWHDENKLVAIADSVRSFPLYFCVKQGRLMISDNAVQLELVHGAAPDVLAEEEMLQTGYVTGHQTLDKNVFQIPAGSMLLADRIAGGVSWKLIPYFELRHAPNPCASEQDLLELLDEAMLVATRRLIHFAAGRTIVIPLSGGYDSRLVATALKRLGYEKLVAFTFGLPENEEARVSKQVASELGIPWLFLNYSKEQWRSTFTPAYQREYFAFANALASVPHIQDWLAIKQLHEREMIPADSILVPGHSGDLLAGSRSNALPEIYQDRPADLQSCTSAILKYHYQRWGWEQCTPDFRQQLTIKVQESLGDISRFADCASPFEAWDMRERQAKFIVNSVRVYDYWGYNWWLPLWDSAFVNCWRQVPLTFRRESRLYKKFVQQAYAEIVGNTAIMTRQVAGNGLMGKMKGMVRHTLLYRPLRAAYQSLRKHLGIDNHYLQVHGVVPDSHPFSKQKDGQGVNAYFASWIVESRRSALRAAA